MQYFRSFIESCSFSVTKMKTLGTQSVPSHPTRSKKINLACYACLCFYLEARKFTIHYISVSDISAWPLPCFLELYWEILALWHFYTAVTLGQYSLVKTRARMVSKKYWLWKKWSTLYMHLRLFWIPEQLISLFLYISWNFLYVKAASKNFMIFEKQPV